MTNTPLTTEQIADTLKKVRHLSWEYQQTILKAIEEDMEGMSMVVSNSTTGVCDGQ